MKTENVNCLVPFHDNIFIERDKAEETVTPGGVVLPGDKKKDPDTATVLAVGPGRVIDNGDTVVPCVVPGDKILIGRHSGTEVNWGIERRIVVPWGDVLGLVKLADKKE